MGIFDDLLDLGTSIVSDTVDFAVDVAKITIDAGVEFVDDPIKYTTDSVTEVAGIVLGATVAPLVNNFSQDSEYRIYPVRGSVIYTDLVFGFAEHSGIYIGGGKVVELCGNGDIQIASINEFTNGGTGVSIFVSCQDGNANGSESIAQNAEQMVGRSRDYNVVLDNCHQFTSGCVTGNFDNSDNFLWMLKDTVKKYTLTNSWKSI